jgi:glycosyltransferase involved in cell wall biosynthesis
MFEMHLSPSVLAALDGVPTVVNVAYYKPICPNGLKLLPDGARCTVQPGAVCWRGGCVSRAHWLRDRPRYARIGRGLASAAGIVTCSVWLQRELAAAGIEAESQVWPIERPGAGFCPARAPVPQFVFAGRLAREKGVEILLRALAQVRGDGLDARLRLVGDGPLRAALERLAGDLDLGEAVEFAGWVPPEQVEAQLADAWALVAPSLWAEPLGLTAVEALVRGIPVIATEPGGFAETVEPGVSGLLVPSGDPSALADALAAVASGGAFPDGLPAEVAARARELHDPDRHIAWLRALLARVAR